MPTRRLILAVGALGGAVIPLGLSAAAEPLPVRSIAMAGTSKGEATWFDPPGLWVPPGTVVRWFTPDDQTQAHTSTAYHPANLGHALRIPAKAAPWDSAYVPPGGEFRVRLTVEGVYDYYCRPHEEAGMVGRIVVGRPSGRELEEFAAAAAAHPEWLPLLAEALRAFPRVDDILRRKQVPPPA